MAALLVAWGVFATMDEIKAGPSGHGILVTPLSLGTFFIAGITMGNAGWVDILLALLGLLAIAAEVFVLPGFGVAGIVGMGMLGAAILLTMLGPAPTASDVAQALAALGAAAAVTLSVGYAWIRKLPTSRRFRGLLLQDRMHSAQGYISAATRDDLVGQSGVALTSLRPAGGMFIWVRLPQGLDSLSLLEKAIAANVAFVSGAPFFANDPQPNTLRLSFVTVPPEKIEKGVGTLGELLRRELA